MFAATPKEMLGRISMEPVRQVQRSRVTLISPRSAILHSRAAARQTGYRSNFASALLGGTTHHVLSSVLGTSHPRKSHNTRAQAVAKPPTVSWFSDENVQALLNMARVHNLVPSSLLVLVGAWAGAGHNFAILLSVKVWLMAALCSGVSAASMVVNDYFDYVSGADHVNAPHKPLPAGQILPDIAVLAGTAVYMTVLAMACLMEPAPLRVLIAASAAATMAYTPLLKKWTIVKNVVVAGVIASALIAGGLAAGVVGGDLRPLLPPCIFAFCGIIYREILMDMTDMDGDRAAGVCTLPVVAGAGPALAAAVGVAACGAVAAVGVLLSSPVLAAVTGSMPERLVASGEWAVAVTCLRAVGGGAVAMHSFAKLASFGWSIYQSGFGRRELDEAVSGCMAPIGLSVIALSAAAM